MGAVRGNDLVAQALVNEGVDTAFFLTGGPIVDVARLAMEKGINCVDTRHEQAASMAAHAYSRVLGKPGVCFAASGPGVTNLVTGIGNAYLDAAPVVTLGGASAMSQDGMGAFQEMDQTAMVVLLIEIDMTEMNPIQTTAGKLLRWENDVVESAAA